MASKLPVPDTAIPFDRIPTRLGACGSDLNTQPYFVGAGVVVFVFVFVAALALGLACALHGLTNAIEVGGIPVAGTVVLLLGLAWRRCIDRRGRRVDPTPVCVQAMRTELGRPSSSM